jgi:hypothetical protein
VVASEKRWVSAAEVEALGFNRDRKIHGGSRNPNAEAGGIQIATRLRTSFILPAMTQFDALHAQKYAHVYDQSAIAN